jgi:hypothetical protein
VPGNNETLWVGSLGGSKVAGPVAKKARAHSGLSCQSFTFLPFMHCVSSHSSDGRTPKLSSGTSSNLFSFHIITCLVTVDF